VLTLNSLKTLNVKKRPQKISSHPLLLQDKTLPPIPCCYRTKHILPSLAVTGQKITFHPLLLQDKHYLPFLAVTGQNIFSHSLLLQDKHYLPFLAVTGSLLLQDKTYPPIPCCYRTNITSHSLLLQDKRLSERLHQFSNPHFINRIYTTRLQTYSE